MAFDRRVLRFLLFHNKPPADPWMVMNLYVYR